MAKRKFQPTMYAMVNVERVLVPVEQLGMFESCMRVLVPVEQLGMFESCMRVESNYTRNEAGNYETHYWISENPKLPSCELVTQDQVIAWQVAGKMRNK